MAQKLTRKQETFVDEYVEHGNGTEAAKIAYDIESPNETDVAKSIASENLTKPYIVKAIAERLDDDKLEKAHNSLLDAVRLDYFVFPSTMHDNEIEEHVSAQGLTVINIRPTQKGKMAFFSLPDGSARSKGLELAYKLKGSFAPDKHISVNVELEATPEIKDLTNKLNELYRGTSKPSHGGGTGPVGAEA